MPSRAVQQILARLAKFDRDARPSPFAVALGCRILARMDKPKQDVEQRLAEIARKAAADVRNARQR